MVKQKEVKMIKEVTKKEWRQVFILYAFLAMWIFSCSCNTVKKGYTKNTETKDSVHLVKNNSLVKSDSSGTKASAEQNTYKKKTTIEFVPVSDSDITDANTVYVDPRDYFTDQDGAIKKSSTIHVQKYRPKIVIEEEGTQQKQTTESAVKSNVDQKQHTDSAKVNASKTEVVVTKDKKTFPFWIVLILIAIAGGYILYRRYKL